MRQSHVAIIGAPMDLGAGRRGVDMGPSAMRLSGLNEKLASLGYEVEDLGNIAVEQPEKLPVGPTNARYLPQIAHTCARSAEDNARWLVRPAIFRAAPPRYFPNPRLHSRARPVFR